MKSRLTARPPRQQNSTKTNSVCDLSFPAYNHYFQNWRRIESIAYASKIVNNA